MTFHIFIVHVKISQVKLLAVKCYHWIFIVCLHQQNIHPWQQAVNEQSLVMQALQYFGVEGSQNGNQSMEFVGSDNSDVTDDLKEATRQMLLVFHSPHHSV